MNDEKLREILEHEIEKVCDQPDCFEGAAMNALRAVQSAARREALEEAAGVAESKFVVDGNDSMREVSEWMAGNQIAKAIRALIGEKK
jgi:hypothetical protein